MESLLKKVAYDGRLIGHSNITQLNACIKGSVFKYSVDTSKGQ